MEGLEAGNGAPMTFDVATSDRETTVITVRGELDIANIEPLEVAVAPIIESKSQRLCVDVSGLECADSPAIALWVRWESSVGEVELRDPSPLLRRVIISMGLGQR